MPEIAAGETKNPSPAEISIAKSRKVVQSRAKPRSGAQAPLTARTDAANNSAAGSRLYGCDPLISLIIFLVLQNSYGPDNIYVYGVAPLAGARIGTENRITGKK